MLKFISVNKIRISFFCCFVTMFLPIKIHSQNLDKIKSLDTLYIYFKNDSITQLKVRNNAVNKENHNYELFFKIESTKIKQQLTLINSYRITPEIKWEKKSFLKKNKDIIVDYNFLKKMGIFESERLLLSKKHIYLIDYDNIHWFKIKIIEVKIADRSGLAPIE